MGEKNRPVLVGDKFGKLIALTYIPGSRSVRAKWVCLCRCGKRTRASSYDLRSSRVRSCGCFVSENSRKMFTTHGATANGRTEKEFWVWCSMRMRCDNSSSPDYKYYGGRGISYSRRWKRYENFIKDMGKRPFGGYSLERRDNDKGYSKSNCYWATRRQQARNRRGNKLNPEMAEMIRKKRDAGGRISHIAREMGLPISTIGTVWYETGWRT